MDGTNGGFLVGKPHSHNGIPVLMKYLDGYRYVAEFEGEEYLLNPGSSTACEDILVEMNDFDRDRMLYDYSILDLQGITVLDCSVTKIGFTSKFLLLDARGSQFVLNKYSTAYYLHKLEKLNNSHTFQFNQDPVRWRS